MKANEKEIVFSIPKDLYQRIQDLSITRKQTKEEVLVELLCFAMDHASRSKDLDE